MTLDQEKKINHDLLRPLGPISVRFGLLAGCWVFRWKRKSHSRAKRDVSASHDSFSPMVNSRLVDESFPRRRALTRSWDSRKTSAAASITRI